MREANSQSVHLLPLAEIWVAYNDRIPMMAIPVSDEKELDSWRPGSQVGLGSLEGQAVAVRSLPGAYT